LRQALIVVDGRAIPEHLAIEIDLHIGYGRR
jgi:hypothetical protein